MRVGRGGRANALWAITSTAARLVMIRTLLDGEPHVP
jgi:hypothetical protein